MNMAENESRDERMKSKNEQGHNHEQDSAGGGDAKGDGLQASVDTSMPGVMQQGVGVRVHVRVVQGVSVSGKLEPSSCRKA